MFTPCQRLKNKTKTKDFVLSDRPFITRHYALSGLAVRVLKYVSEIKTPEKSCKASF